PNIITIYEIGETDNTHFIAAEYIEGDTLRERLKGAPINLKSALEIAIQVASALDAAHRTGIVHRDIKPDNVMIRPDGLVKILDFGIAKLTEKLSETDLEAATEAQTRAGTIIGTAAYMSPEQARGQTVDARSDIFSFGVMLYEMLVGKRPFEGVNAVETIGSILNKEPVPLSRQTPDVPHEIERIINKTLRKDREERYQTTKDLLIDLKDVKQDLEFQNKLERTAAPDRVEAKTQVVNATTSDIAPPTTSSAEYIVNSIKHHELSAVLGLVLLIIASTALFFFLNRSPALTEKDTILLTDFVNTTGDPIFDGTLKQALAVQLGQSPFLNIFSEDRVREALKFMGRPAEERVTRDVGREICQRQGLKAMLAGSIGTMGNHYVITVEAIDAQKGDTIAREQVEAESKERVLRALGEAATKLREQFGESLASIQKFDAPIEQATTSSLEAFKAYTLGVEQHHKGKYLEAIPLYKRATDLDPNFALAYARLAAVYVNSRQFGLAAEASQKAYDLRERVSERERLFIAANYYDDVTREVEKKIETLELWKRTYPLDFVPHNNLALQYNNLGQYEKAVEEAREAIGRNPNAAPAYSNLAQAFVGLNRLDEAKEVIERALSQKIETMWMHRNLYLIAFVRGDAAAMKQQIEWANGKPDEYAAQRWQAETAAFSGQLRKAREFSDRAVELALRRDLKDVAAEMSVSSAARGVFFGDCKQVKGQTAQALAITQSY
ncbi:MAG: protein kinase, partial [Acidobacteria bacterium]|nr:protein kinase [Acidobacteriota bacterium]